MIQLNLSCHKCGAQWQQEPPIGRRDECPKCHSDAKCCLNCRWYDRGAHHECREEQAEWVKEKAQGNFCGLFVPKPEPGAGPSGKAAEQAKAQGKLDLLFGGPKPEAEPEKPGASLADQLKRFLDEKK